MSEPAFFCPPSSSLPTAICAAALAIAALPAQCANVIDITPGTASVTNTRDLTNAFGQELWFSQTVGFYATLWKWDPVNGVVAIESSTSTTAGLNPESPTPCCTALGPRVFFDGFQIGHGRELYTSDGTTAGTGRIKEIEPGSTGGLIYQITACDERVFFNATQSGLGDELWVSDGTTAGTMLVKDIEPGIGNGRPQHMLALNGVVVFSAYQTTTGRELWISDGTAAGTQLLADIRPGPDSGWPFELVRVGNYVYFNAYTPAAGNELWRTDGTPSGTVLVADIRPGTASGNPTALCACGDKVFFNANLNIAVNGLWVSDGTAAGTTYLGVRASQMVSSGNRLFFKAETIANGYEPWISDGTPAGTELIRDLVPGALGSNPQNMLAAASGVFFSASTTIANELWYSDGTSAGTNMICTLDPGGTGAPQDMTMCRGHLFFTAYSPSVGKELFWIETPGAATAQLGSGSRPDHPTLATQNDAAPVLGTTLDLLAEGPSGHVGILLAGGAVMPWPALVIPGLVDGGCDQIGLLAGQAIMVATSLAQSFSWSFVLPNNPTLEGALFQFQTLWWDPVGSPPFQLSNGLQLALGPVAPH